MTFAEIVDAARAKLGHRVRVTMFDEHGRVTHTACGELAPGRLAATEAVAEADGKVIFRVAPAARWFMLNPEVVVDAEADKGGKLLWVELLDGKAILIETLSARGEARTQKPQGRPTDAELRKARGREGRERARMAARERARQAARRRAR